ncbi:MAG: serine--tRNA ligase [Sphingobium sp.]|nr:serine--tRNA ligase [Sphingobium sp.]MBP6111778.1 serine--tRNA ligase [Sphingobium sp.]MBP8671250.1 serine--tRNA ligase [Sphingobium sp.]MBP9156315.1 serine--tRNA ligase [Sphingobium sp.]MCC6481367.1 serine--tRNA ligase [Sphingomonadaceae bacterium]
MHDIRYIRDNPQAFDEELKRRGLEGMSAELLALDETRRAQMTALQNGLARRKDLSALFGKAKSQGTELSSAELAELQSLKNNIPQGEAEVERLERELNAMLAAIPNLPAADVPEGADEHANVEVSRWGTPRSFEFSPQDHADFGPALGLDFESAAAMSGARFAALRGGMARLHRALAQFMLDTQTGQNGYEEVNPPLLVRDATLYGTGQLPKFAEDLFQTTEGRWLIPTAEVSLTNLVREQIVADATLPLRFTALTPCFRSEAGSAGRDTRGYIRQHQFEKVELVSICRPEDSAAEHEHMLASAEGILQALGLPHRKVLLCTGDMGFSAAKTYDLEVWLPSQNTYREISSVSNCGEFQARRMNARYRPEGEKGTRFLHTLNGSGLAVGRTLVAVLENYQQADGSVIIPAILHPYMGGVTHLQPKAK